MPPLATNLRGQLERAVSDARDVAETAAVAAMTAIGVESDARPGHLDEATNGLRLALRARGRTLGKGSLKDGMPALIEEVAYEQWHRMLFARFLAENRLLIEPGSKQPLSLKDCEELAQEEGIDDPWLLAASFASEMLPGIFRADDPAVQLRLAPEGRAKLEALLAALPPDVFTADDALGWVYQFWQAKKKDEVNRSGRKIGGEDIAPVTQLFTEHYMVRFLLENSLGAWWAARHPGSPLLKEWEYLRFRDDGTPAAGTFAGWPEHAKDVTVMDPCCGSGHFLVAAADMLRKMRIEEEGLSAADAAAAVLKDNLFGLELDARCTQIAAFALAFDAWKAAGYRDLPLPNVACSGVAVGGSAKEWMDLAGDDGRLRYTLERLWELFKDAPDLGSLINPTKLAVRDRMFTADYEEVVPLLHAALAKHGGGDPAAAVFGSAAEGAARAGQLLARRYTLVATNPPYRGSGDLGETIKRALESGYGAGAANLATAFLLRCLGFATDQGTCALVLLHEWLFLKSYEPLRRAVLRDETLAHVSRLGARAFGTISGERVNVALIVFHRSPPVPSGSATGADVSSARTPADKDHALKTAPLTTTQQAEFVRNPDLRIVFGQQANLQSLEQRAFSPQGVKTGDDDFFRQCFWEQQAIGYPWRRYQSTVKTSQAYGGLLYLLRWRGKGDGIARPQGLAAWGKSGVCVSQIGDLPASLYLGHAFDSNVSPVVPRDPADLAAIWAFCSSPDFRAAVRRLDQKMNVANATLVKVPFDRARWDEEAGRRYPDGLPEPHSDDPTQWLFRGTVTGSASPLQVAVARLLGYRWPDQEPDSLDTFEDDDGIVCLPPVQGEQPAAERLRALLADAHANPPSGPRPKGAPPWPALPPTAHEWIEQLLASVGYTGKTLEEWLRDGFFEQHFKLFHQRPFVWHIDDGLKGKGFSALVNYHKLDGPKLDRLIYTYLQSYIEATKAQVDAGTAGADARLKASVDLKTKLEAIRHGEPPYDIYVRWKKLPEQPIGWAPDLDDGVRLNIRPWMTAGVLRKNPNIKWGVDRGTNPDGTKRDNDLHYTRAEKEAARRAAGVPS